MNVASTSFRCCENRFRCCNVAKVNLNVAGVVIKCCENFSLCCMQHDLCCDGVFATVLFLSATVVDLTPIVSRSDGCACVRFFPLLRTSGR
jgi:hypothetical protein